MPHTDLSAAHELWHDALAHFKAQLSDQSFATWIQPLSPIRFEGHVLTLSTPTQFHREWIEGHYLTAIESCLRERAGGEVRVRFEIVPREEETPAPETKSPPRRTRQSKQLVPPTSVELAASEAAESMDAPSMNGIARHGDHDSQLNPRYVFETFIEGDSNSFARAACLAMSDLTRKCPWNPLLIYGGSGLGKTHLLQAIGNRVLLRNTSAKVLYVTSERFTQEFIHSVRTSNTTEFASRYRSIDLLLVDDIQFFAAKERTQIEFFHAFNALYQSGKRIALTCDRPLVELAGFDQRLLSRFDSGLVTNIDPPDYETRVAILQARAHEDQFPLAKEVADLLATHITQNVRELEGVYVTLVARCQLLRVPPTVELAREIIRAKTGQYGGRPPAEKIFEVVGEHYGFSVEALRGKSRKAELAHARMVALYLMTELTPLSLKGIGQLCGGRDHSTVIHARDTIAERRAGNDPDVSEALGVLLNKLSLFTLVSARRSF